MESVGSSTGELIARPRAHSHFTPPEISTKSHVKQKQTILKQRATSGRVRLAQSEPRTKDAAKDDGVVLYHEAQTWQSQKLASRRGNLYRRRGNVLEACQGQGLDPGPHTKLVSRRYRGLSQSNRRTNKAPPERFLISDQLKVKTK